MNPNWSENYEVGNHEIDHHHKELFQLTSLLDLAIQTNDATYLDKIISFLEHYVVDHFQEEETLMKKHNFKGLDFHQQEHQQFRENVNTLRKHFDQMVSKTHIIFSIRRVMDDLICHIISVDSQIKSLEVNHEEGA